MQGAGFRALGLQATYELVEVPPEGLSECVGRLVREGYAGWNATVPHKEQLATLMHDLDPAAGAAGCVNTVVNAGGRLKGYSTDGVGLERAIAESFGLAVLGARFLFLGTGGAARATAVYFAGAGAAEIVLVNRTVSKAEVLAASITAAAPGCPVRCLPLAEAAAVGRVLGRMDCLIQSTSLGLHAGEAPPLDPTWLPPPLAVMDMIYGNTPFLLGARARGCRTADGRGMLLHQGARSFELWTGRQAPVEAMRAGLEQALAARR
jgi:shikimate dehydrogenase